MDAILALIPVFVVMAGVSSLTYDPTTHLTVPMTRQAHDSLELILHGDTTLASQYISTGDATNITSSFNFSMTYSYMLEYSNSSNTTWVFVTGRSTSGTSEAAVDSAKAAAENIYVAQRIYFYNTTRHTFRTFVWFE